MNDSFKTKVYGEIILRFQLPDFNLKPCVKVSMRVTVVCVCVCVCVCACTSVCVFYLYSILFLKRLDISYKEFESTKTIVLYFRENVF